MFRLKRERDDYRALCIARTKDLKKAEDLVEEYSRRIDNRNELIGDLQTKVTRLNNLVESIDMVTHANYNNPTIILNKVKELVHDYQSIN